MSDKSIIANFSLVILISTFTAFSLQQASAQSTADIKTVSGLVSAPLVKQHSRFPSYQKNAVKLIAGTLIFFYQNYISSQDGSHCTFSPSCSAYALQSIRKKGLFIGLLCTFDRLTRCNGLNNDKYPIRKGTHLLYDPVD